MTVSQLFVRINKNNYYFKDKYKYNTTCNLYMHLWFLRIKFFFNVVQCPIIIKRFFYEQISFDLDNDFDLRHLCS